MQDDVEEEIKGDNSKLADVVSGLKNIWSSFPSGQRCQTVNLRGSAFVGSNPTCSTTIKVYANSAIDSEMVIRNKGAILGLW